MPNNPNAADNLKPIKKGEVRNPTGRPKKISTIIHDVFLEEHNVKLSKAQTEEIIKSILSRNKTELIELAKNDQLPFWISLIAKKAQMDFERGSIELIEKLFDRVYGKPRETIDQNIESKVFNVTLKLEEPNKTSR
jgi:hypothetical protein